jgi:hypothetical protein
MSSGKQINMSNGKWLVLCGDTRSHRILDLSYLEREYEVPVKEFIKNIREDREITEKTGVYVVLPCGTSVADVYMLV